jgi:hypothetical protein
MNLVKENSETIPKSKRKEKNQNRKTQPITSLKGKIVYSDTSVEDGKSKSLPRQSSTAVKMGSQSGAPTRLPMLRYDSAPGSSTVFVTFPPIALSVGFGDGTRHGTSGGVLFVGLCNLSDTILSRDIHSAIFPSVTILSVAVDASFWTSG